MIKQKNLLVIAGISGALCVALGAMGAHALKDILSEESKQTFETAVKYHFYHTLALLAVMLLAEKLPSKLLRLSALFFIIGILLFSFSLYFLALRSLIGITPGEMKWVGAITPLGGVAFIAAWLMLSYAAIKSEKK